MEELFAYDATGKPLPGWPQKIGRQAILALPLGNVFGDDKMEVILPDQHGHILAWTWDGQPFGNTFPEKQGQVSQGPANALTPQQLEDEKCTSIFKDKIECTGQVALADLDGDRGWPKSSCWIKPLRRCVPGMEMEPDSGMQTESSPRLGPGWRMA